MKISTLKSLALFLTLTSTLAALADLDPEFTDLEAEKLSPILAEPRFEYLTDTQKEFLGSCLKREFVKCMTQNCSYCPGDGSCSDCDKPKPCSSCSVGCKVTPDGRGADFCAEGCAAAAASHCWF